MNRLQAIKLRVQNPIWYIGVSFLLLLSILVQDVAGKNLLIRLLAYATASASIIGLSYFSYHWLFVKQWGRTIKQWRKHSLFIRRYKRLQKTTLVRFLSFSIVGTVGLLVDLLFFSLGIHLGIPHVFARASSFWIATVNNWYLNRTLTFSDRNKQGKKRELSRYIGMCVVSFLVNWGLYTSLTLKVTFFANYIYLAFFLGIAAGLLINFIGSNFIVFQQHEK